MNNAAHVITPHVRVLARALAAASVLLAVSPFAAAQDQPKPDAGRERSGERQPRGGLREQMRAFKTDVPAHPFNIILVRPTHTSVTASIVSNSAAAGFVEWSEVRAGESPKDVTTFSHRSEQQALSAGNPTSFVLAGLKPGAAYVYRWRWKDPARTGESAPGANTFESSESYTFRTPRAAGQKDAEFCFTIQADSHLDANVSPAAYLQTLANALADGPDFHVDLGDTFMTDQRREFKTALPHYVAQRYYFGRLCHSAPLFMVLGNHDGEAGYAARGEESIAAWSFAQRTRLFPAPEITPGPDPMYTGRTAMSEGIAGNYYAYTWGEAQFIVLDPFWFTTTRERGAGRGGGGGTAASDLVNTDDNWNRTLGKEQYDWLARTLESSTSRYTFVFIHHLVGGLGRAVRGGVESSVYFEWGGENADGSPGFAVRRAGWAMPIHDLLAAHHVSAVFHGHDHLYVHNERDGVVYQCVPQPGNIRGGTRSAEEYGYRSGEIMGSPGHLRVHVGADGATVAFVRSAPAEEEGRAGRGREAQRETNGAVVHEYTIRPFIRTTPERSRTP